nr:hypothetical protein [uncultured Oscillibacter sp.]
MKKRMFAALLFLLLLSSCGVNPEPLPFEELPEDYSLERAKDDGCLVTEDGAVTSGQEAWEEFLNAAEAGKAASVRLCSYYTLDDPSRYDPDYYESVKDDYPMMFLKDLSYDGERFTTLSYEEGQRHEETYSFLRRREQTAPSSGVKIIQYIITDDAESSLEKIGSQLYSSSFSPEDWIPFDIVYQEIIPLEA